MVRPDGGQMIKKLVDRQFISKSTSNVTVAGGAFVQNITVPTGYGILCGFYFNPGNDISVTIFAQNANTNILVDFSTAVGSALGFINPRYRTAPNDIIQLTCTPNVLASTPQRITFTLEFA